MTTPKLAFNYIKTWGSPWHGLVKNGVLTLPNDETMQYPQPSNGNSYLIRYADTPGVSRSTEQLALDAVEGKQWRNDAIIAGEHQLHGKSISSPWLHKDELGRVWAVGWSGSGFILTITLTDFGRIGLDLTPRPEVVRTINLGFDASGVQLQDVAPDGRQAVFKSIVGNTRFFTVTISDLEISRQVVKDIGEVIVDFSDLVETDETAYDNLFFIHFKSDFSTQTAQWSDTPFDQSTPGNLLYANRLTTEVFNSISSRTIIVGAFYNSLGALKFPAIKMIREIRNTITTTSSGSAQIAATLDYCTGEGGGESISSVVTEREYIHEYTHQVMINDDVLDENKVSATGGSDTVNSATTTFNTPECWFSSGGSWQSRLPGVTVTDGNQFTPRPTEWRLNGAVLSADDSILESYLYSFSGNNLRTSIDDLPDVWLKIVTNKLLHAYIEYKYQPGYLLGAHIAPDAINDETSFTLDPATVYATYNPATFEIARDHDSPVAFV